MGAMLRRLPALAGLAVLAGTCAEAAGNRAFARLVRRDVQALQARAAPARAGVVTEEMLTDLPEPVARYLRYTGVVGKPFAGTIQLHQKGKMRPPTGGPWMALDAEEHYSVQPPGFVWAGTPWSCGIAWLLPATRRRPAATILPASGDMIPLRRQWCPPRTLVAVPLLGPSWGTFGPGGGPIALVVAGFRFQR
jgi:uncharacterized protein DUF6544